MAEHCTGDGHVHVFLEHHRGDTVTDRIWLGAAALILVAGVVTTLVVQDREQRDFANGFKKFGSDLSSDLSRSLTTTTAVETPRTTTTEPEPSGPPPWAIDVHATLHKINDDLNAIPAAGGNVKTFWAPFFESELLQIDSALGELLLHTDNEEASKMTDSLEKLRSAYSIAGDCAAIGPHCPTEIDKAGAEECAMNLQALDFWGSFRPKEGNFVRPVCVK